MARKTHISFALTLVATLALAGCGLFSSTETAPPKPPDFTVAEGEGKIFVYAFYENPDDKSSFGDVFRITVDGGFRGDIDDGEYVQGRLAPGVYSIDIDDISWTGNVVAHATLKTAIKSDQPHFYVAHLRKDAITGDLKLDILNPPAAEGMRQVAARTSICGCGL